MEIGIVGLPNVGKSTLFNTLTNSSVAASNFPFTTIEPNVGITSVPDSRLTNLKNIFNPEKTTPSVIKFVDIAGLVKDAHSGAGLGNKFLSHIRSVDAIIQIVRSFPDEKIVNTLPECNPTEEIEIIQTELMLADLDQAIKAKEKLSGLAHCGNKKAQQKVAILAEIIQSLNSGKPLYELNVPSEELKEHNFLTLKPVLFALNTSDKSDPELANKTINSIKLKKNCDVLTINVQMEYEILQLADDTEKTNFKKELGITGDDISLLIKKAYGTLGLITFYTIVGGKELRAWPITKGTTAKQAAGKIHTDIEKGFICAEVYSYDELVSRGTEKSLQESGMVRNEGRDYVVNDGDIIKIRWQ
jgi:hypothetical protein